jgi:hypothetical protein
MGSSRWRGLRATDANRLCGWRPSPFVWISIFRSPRRLALRGGSRSILSGNKVRGDCRRGRARCSGHAQSPMFYDVVARTNWRGMQGEISSLFAGDP